MPRLDPYDNEFLLIACREWIMSKVLNISGNASDIWVGSRALDYLLVQKGSRGYIIYDEYFENSVKSVERVLCESGWKTVSLSVVGGDRLKKFDSIYPIYGNLLELGADRNSVLFALGGGSIGDVVGFVAATFMRGISWVGIPTTLLSQVDSSVGGKTGINHIAGKNLIGAFHHPVSVYCDLDFLRSLPRREIISGVGEIVKYAIIADPEMFNTLENRYLELIDLESELLKYTIHRCLKIKSEIVAQDEFDRNGIREVLNFGHTFGQALESACPVGYFRHGEAVIWGMRFAIALSGIINTVPAPVLLRVDDFLKKLPIPEIPVEVDFEKLVAKMKVDKKNQNGNYRFVLLTEIGKTSIETINETDLLKAYLALRTSISDGEQTCEQITF